VPSLHFGYAFIVGVAVAALARRPNVRLVGAAYPAFMLFIIVATGNHFLFDAFAGGVVAVAGWLIAKVLVADIRGQSRARTAPQHRSPRERSGADPRGSSRGRVVPT